MKALRWGGPVLFALLAVPGTAGAAADLTGAGTVSGDLTAGSQLSVNLHVQHTQGWQHIQVISVQLELHGSVLEQLQVAPGQSSIAIAGGGAPDSLGQTAKLQGDYFEVNPAKVALTARGDTLRMQIPIKLRLDPPGGATLSFSASAVPVAELGPKALTPPVESSSGFSWGTLGAAILAALLLGGFLGSVLGVRRRPPPRISVYDSVQRRIERDRMDR